MASNCHKCYQLSATRSMRLLGSQGLGGVGLGWVGVTNKAPHPLLAIISTQTTNGWTSANVADGKN